MNTIDGMITGPKLRAIRAIRGISQADLAAKAGISTTAIAQFETGKRDLRTSTVRKLCAALDVEVVYRLKGDGTEISVP